MEDKNNLSTIKNLVDTARSVIVILPPDPSKDMVIAGASLNLALKSSGKLSQIGCGSEIHVDPNIEGVSEITNTIGSRNLVISFNYLEDDLDKVDYDVRDDGKFYLLVKPKANAPVPDISDVKYSYSGASADLVITLGVNSLEELGKIYAEEKNFLDNATILSLNTSLRPAAFTDTVYHKNFNSFSELVANLIEETKLQTNPQLSGSLLSSIYESTDRLTTNLSADTFAALAFLMRSGANLPSAKPTIISHLSQAPFFDTPEAPISSPVEEEIPLPEEENTPVPSDWSQPKIFRVSKKTGE